jgi:hypothetical protein
MSLLRLAESHKILWSQVMNLILFSLPPFEPFINPALWFLLYPRDAFYIKSLVISILRYESVMTFLLLWDRFSLQCTKTKAEIRLLYRGQVGRIIEVPVVLRIFFCTNISWKFRPYDYSEKFKWHQRLTKLHHMSTTSKPKIIEKSQIWRKKCFVAQKEFSWKGNCAIDLFVFDYGMDTPIYVGKIIMKTWNKSLLI